MSSLAQRFTNNIKRFGNFVLERRSRAAMLVFLLNIFPTFFSMIAAMIFALVTLRKGAKEGLFLLPWAILPFCAQAYAMHYPITSVIAALLGWLVFWLCAIVLKHYSSWSAVIQVAVILAMLFVFIFHWYVGDVQAYWVHSVKNFASQVANSNEMSNFVQPGFLLLFSKIATGLGALLFTLSIVMKLVMARWWQALMFNPGGLRKELHSIVLPRWMLALLVLVLVGVFSGHGLSMDVSIPLLGAYVIAGLSLLHAWVVNYRFNIVLLILFYVAVYIFPKVLLVVVLAAIVNSLFYFTPKIKK